MSQNAFSTLAMLAALAFLAMAITACASSEHAATAPPSQEVAAKYGGQGVSEFHGARIGEDSLRGELPSEN